jgi:hypothetical protein
MIMSGPLNDQRVRGHPTVRTASGERKYSHGGYGDSQLPEWLIYLLTLPASPAAST